MNQLDIPPISFARYVDLLKRRRWQVIPTTLAGLVVGAIVALVIPRYYVAKTTITYKGGAFDKARGTAADPLFAKVSNAKLTLPNTLESTLESLNLIGTNPNDPDRQGLITNWTSRVDVTGFSFEQGQSYYNIEIVVRDRDGPLSALVANKLRKDWIDSVLHDLEVEASQAAQSLNTRVAQARQASDELLKELEALRAQYGIQPDKAPDLWKYDKQRYLEDDIRENSRRIEELQRTIGEANDKLKVIRDDLSTLRPMVPITQAGEAKNPELEAMLSTLNFQLTLIEIKKAYLVRPRDIQAAELEAQEVRGQIAALTGDSGTGKEVLVENPERTSKLKEQLVIEQKLHLDEKTLDLLQKKAEKLEVQKKDLNEAFTAYDAYLLKREAILTRKADLEAQQADQEQRAEAAKRGQVFEQVDAQPPPAPTEPGFLLVALAGSIVGLGAAIGFVLLVDFLRATFKTVDDVGYALGVPILGVMAHLETAEERARTVHQRRRVSLIAASFVVLSLSLVTVYYTRPTSLPTWVIQVLDRVLGSDPPR